jgi:hypothetical protein
MPSILSKRELIDPDDMYQLERGIKMREKFATPGGLPRQAVSERKRIDGEKDEILSLRKMPCERP